MTSQGRKAEKGQSEASISNCRRDKEQLAASAGRQRARVLFYLEMRAPSPSKSEERERLPDMALWSQIIVLAFPNQIILLMMPCATKWHKEKKMNKESTLRIHIKPV